MLDRPASTVRKKCSFRPDPILYREFSVPACIRPDVSVSCPDASQYSISFWFLSKFQEREDQSTIRTMWYPVRTSDSCGPDGSASKKKIVDSTSTVRTTAYHGPDVSITVMEIACWRIAVRTLIPQGPDARKPYKEITYSRRATVRMMPLNRKDFPVKFLENLIAQLSVRTAHVHRPNGAQYIYPNAHLSPQPINRGPWALRTTRIRYWIPQLLRDMIQLWSPFQVYCCCATTEVYLRGRL